MQSNNNLKTYYIRIPFKYRHRLEQIVGKAAITYKHSNAAGIVYSLRTTPDLYMLVRLSTESTLIHSHDPIDDRELEF